MNKEKAISEADSVLEEATVISRKSKEIFVRKIGYVLFITFLTLAILSWYFYGYAPYQLGFGFVASFICFSLPRKKRGVSEIPLLNKPLFFISIISLLIFLGIQFKAYFITD